MKKVSLLFGIHMHQPVDNFDDTVARAVTLCYAPFFETMLHYPAFKFSLHCSGWLLEKIRVSYPQVFQNMKTLTQKGAVEWFGGGYYEPILSAIPSRDRRAQIKKLSRYLKKHFDADVKGLWLTERVWDASLVCDLRACGIEHVMIDDYHFLSNGYEKEKMNGYYLTEDNAEELRLFPISKKLRYALPFSEPEASLASVLSFAEDGASAAIFFDDAEKFGLWPHTHEWVYEQRWLEQFVQAVLKNEQCQTEHYGDYIQHNRPLGLAYLNGCSYMEMGEWSLQTSLAEEMEALKQKVGADYYNTTGMALIKGGIWKNFFIKYHESNYLHKRMLYLSSRQKEYDVPTRDALYRLQTNDAYWHGVFGGFYLPSLRDNAYRYLLEIEKAQASKEIMFALHDIDKDGYDELKVLSEELSIVISMKNGAQVVEFGTLDALFNWQNTIMRRKEPYHNEIMKADDEGIQKDHDTKVATIHNIARYASTTLKDALLYDSHAKNSFIDHFSHEAFTMENFRSLTYREAGDFATGDFVLADKTFVREGNLSLEDQTYAATVQKKYLFEKNKIVLQSRFETQYTAELHFAQEFNLHFAHPHKVTFNGKKIGTGLYEQASQELVIVDDFTHKVLTVRINKACDIFGVVLHSVSESEQGFESIAQQVSFILTGPFVSGYKLQLSIEVNDV